MRRRCRQQVVHYFPCLPLQLLRLLVHQFSTTNHVLHAYAMVYTQGHFQVLFHKDHCPIFQHELSWLQRIMYLQVRRRLILVIAVSPPEACRDATSFCPRLQPLQCSQKR